MFQVSCFKFDFVDTRKTPRFVYYPLRFPRFAGDRNPLRGNIGLTSLVALRAFRFQVSGFKFQEPLTFNR